MAIAHNSYKATKANIVTFRYIEGLCDRISLEKVYEND